MQIYASGIMEKLPDGMFLLIFETQAAIFLRKYDSGIKLADMAPFLYKTGELCYDTYILNKRQQVFFGCASYGVRWFKTEGNRLRIGEWVYSWRKRKIYWYIISTRSAVENILFLRMKKICWQKTDMKCIPIPEATMNWKHPDGNCCWCRLQPPGHSRPILR